MIISEVPYNDVLALRHRVMYPDKDIDFVKLDNDDRGLHIGVFENGKPVSVMSIFLHGREVQFRKLATLNEMQGQGYASALMKWLIEYATDMQFDRQWCNARVDACGLYEKLGYKKTDERCSKNGIDSVVMECSSGNVKSA